MKARKISDGRRNAVREAVDDPNLLARLFLQRQCSHPDGRTLRRWRGEWWLWNGAAYKKMPEDELRAHVSREARWWFRRLHRRGEDTAPHVRKVTTSLVTNVMESIATYTMLSAATERPTWLGKQAGPWPAAEVLAAPNGLLHVSSGEALPPTPLYFTTNAIDYDVNTSAPQPAAWLRFLGDLWPDDAQAIELLRMWFGYCLTSDTSQQKLLFLVGPPRAGKGVIARVLRGLLGEHNVAGPTLNSLATSFGLWPLLDRTLAIVADARLGHRADDATIVERLLSVTGEDSLMVDRKYAAPVEAKLNARFMLMSNELPKLADASGALANRMLILRLERSYLDKEDVGLTERLLAERAGILRWALGGLKRLRAEGRFFQPDSGKELAAQMKDITSPVAAFVSQRCVTGADHQVEKAKLYKAWRAWCEAEGRDHPGTLASFARDLRAAFPTVGSAHPRVGGRQVYVFSGIALAG